MAIVLADVLSRLLLVRACVTKGETVSALLSATRVPKQLNRDDNPERSSKSDVDISKDISTTEGEMGLGEFCESGIVFSSRNSIHSMPETSNFDAGNNAGNPEAAAFLLVKLPLEREGTSEEDFIIPTSKEIALAQKLGDDLETVRQ